MKNDNKLFYLLLTGIIITVALGGITLGYQWGMSAYEDLDKPPYEPERVETFIYELKEGKDGILRVSIDADSLAYIVYVQKGDTFALDHVVRSEYDSLVAVLYPEL